jgi:hypothetical protein
MKRRSVTPLCSFEESLGGIMLRPQAEVGGDRRLEYGGWELEVSVK